MGFASHEGKAFAIERLKSLPASPEVFLDLGAGAGSWMEAVKPHFLDSLWIAMEVWPQYVERFCLRERYGLVRVEDIRTANLNEVDVVIEGDVLEHMSTDDAMRVWKKSREAARMGVILSIPIIHYEQHHVHGNPYQEHVRPDWSHEEVMDTLPGITASTQGKTVGTYWAAT